MRFRPVSQLSVRSLDWLWQHRLALGELALLEGDPGMGKSLATLDLAARVTTGRALPDGSPGPAAANVLLLNAEDSPAVLKPRLERLGADLDRVFFFEPDDDDPGPGPAFPRDLDLLDHELARTKARLVIMDPLADFLDRSIFSHSDQSIRRALHPLARLAARHQAVGLLVRHLNKSRSPRALYRGHGSIGLAGVCRSTWLIAPDPGQPDRRVLAQVKNNYAPPQPSLAFSVTSPPPGLPLVCWQGPCELSADALLAGPPKAPPPPGPGQRARDLLRTLLADGPRPFAEILTRAADQDVSKRTLQRAKEEVGVRHFWVWVEAERITHWILPGQELPAHIPPEAIELDLAELQEKLKRVRGLSADPGSW